MDDYEYELVFADYYDYYDYNEYDEDRYDEAELQWA